MFKYFINLLIIIIILLLTSCDQVNINPPKDQQYITKSITKNLPATHYYLEDQSCQQQKEIKIIKSAKIWTFEDQQAYMITVNYNNTISFNSLSNNIIAKTTYRGSFYRLCDEKTYLSNKKCVDKYGLLNSYKRNKESLPLKICKSTYKRYSYEAIALSSAKYLEQNYQLFHAAFPQKSLEKISLNIMQNYENILTNPNHKDYNISFWLVDNLGYFKKDSSITVFPESKKHHSDGKRHLWESGFILAHELGHHIFTQLIGLKDDTPFWTPIKECFADLNAFYSEKENAESIHNIEGMGIDRDLNFQHLENGTLKILTSKILTDYLDPNIHNRNKDPHFIGATLIAYALNKIFTKVVSNNPLIIEKYKLAVNWLLALDTIPPNKDDIFAPVISAIGPAIKKYNKGKNISTKLKQTICDICQNRLPGINQKPFQSCF